MTGESTERLRVVATRPQPQNDRLVSALEAAGVEALACPLFILEAVVRPDQARTAALLAQPEVMAIFVSPAAARFGTALNHQKMSARAVAVGAGTARALRAEGVVDVLEPPEGAIGSEAVLDMAELKDLSGQSVVIVQGDRPRGLLQQELHGRGATVVELSCYRRRETDISSNDFMDLCLSPAADALIVSSLGAWRRIERLAATRLDELSPVTLIAVSDRVRGLIDASGWRGRLVVSNGVEAGAILKALETFPRPR